MIAAQRPSALRTDSPLSISTLQQQALRLLREASEAASAQACNVWQFAVEIGQLYAVGLRNTDLRQLLCLGYLEHARERTTRRSAQRIFLPLDNLMLPNGTCFVLTSKGREAANDLDAEESHPIIDSSGSPSEANDFLKHMPRWDAATRRLWWQESLIKEFRRPAFNQELLLAALEEEGWPTRIDDPLPQTLGIDPKVRLHEAIKALNRHQRCRIIRFGGDGSGRGIQWFLIEKG